MTVALICVGCAPANHGPTLREKEDMMLADPMGYKPEHVNTDITGGDTAHWDKDAFKRDMDHVANP
jgi:hypothetical protein